MTRRTHRAVLASVASVVVLTAGSTVAIAAAGGAFNQSSPVSCAAPDLPGTVVDVGLVDMGNMMGGNSMMDDPLSGPPATHMRLLAAPTSVPSGTVSFRVHNNGTRTHELVVLPLGSNHKAGQHTVGSDARIDEAGTLGEASRTCGSGAGEGIDAGAAGWVTLPLRPGSYELVCNLKHHYSSGMFKTLIVR